MTNKYKKYKKAFKVACELLNGNWLYGYDADKIFDTVMKRDGCVSSLSYEEFILEHLGVLTGKEEDTLENVYLVKSEVKE